MSNRRDGRGNRQGGRLKGDGTLAQWQRPGIRSSQQTQALKGRHSGRPKGGLGVRVMSPFLGLGGFLQPTIFSKILASELCTAIGQAVLRLRRNLQVSEVAKRLVCGAFPRFRMVSGVRKRGNAPHSKRFASSVAARLLCAHRAPAVKLAVRSPLAFRTHFSIPPFIRRSSRLGRANQTAETR
jgi:hypothetical protein